MEERKATVIFQTVALGSWWKITPHVSYPQPSFSWFYVVVDDVFG